MSNHEPRVTSQVPSGTDSGPRSPDPATPPAVVRSRDSGPAIRVQNLGKEYLIGRKERGRETFREMLTSSLAAPIRRLRTLRGQAAESDRIWALKDVSFEIQSGEVVGVIGRNGAGKSTLLKILSRITSPTTGRVELKGRVGSLLEVGTGFHPELTGRENIYLNGAILGMSRREIDRKFDEIVSFAEIEQFLDTPVKRYSSGMYVRLAFSVAAHLEPEIMLVDEVLAVGDVAFQAKCVGKMGEVAEGGRTVLFVSHNMDAVDRLCTRVLSLDDGMVVRDGGARDVIEDYLERSMKQTSIREGFYARTKSGQAAYLKGAELLDANGKGASALRFGEPFAVSLRVAHEDRTKSASYSIRFFNERNQLVAATNTIDEDVDCTDKGVYEVVARFPDNCLVPGRYFVSIGCYVRPHTTVFNIERCLVFSILDVPYSVSFRYKLVGQPVIQMPTEWAMFRAESG